MPKTASPAAIPVVLAAAAFAITLGYGFVWDDYAMFARPWFGPPVTRPVAEATLWLNHIVSDAPAGFHAINVLLHMLAVWLLYDALRRIISPTASMVAAAVFAVHPLQAEAVTYIWARSTLVMTVLCLMSLREWLRGRLWWATAFFVLALLGKQECVAFPIFLVLLDPAGSRRKWKPLAVMLAAALGIGAYVLWVANTTPGSQAGEQAPFSPAVYLATEGLVVLRYLGAFVMPLFAPAPAFEPAPHAIAWLAVLLIAAFALWRWSRGGMWVIAGLILLLPTSSIFAASDVAADRRMYLPLIAFCAGAGLLLARVRTLWAAALVLALAVLCIRQTLFWQSDESLWREVLRKEPDSVRARLHLAERDPSAAIRLLERAKELAPTDARVASALGRAYLNQAGPAKALGEFGRALAFAPNDPQALSNRGVALLALGQTDAARADFRRALEIDPCAFEPRFNLARAGERTSAPSDCRYTRRQREALEGVR